MTTPYIAGDPEYRYPAAGDPLPDPITAKCLILTAGGICTVSIWSGADLAWARCQNETATKRR